MEAKQENYLIGCGLSSCPYLAACSWFLSFIFSALGFGYYVGYQSIRATPVSCPPCLVTFIISSNKYNKIIQFYFGENVKSLLKIDLNKWRGIPCVERLDLVTVSSFPKLINKFSIVLINLRSTLLGTL